MADESSRRGIGEGAAQSAPTAPHATPRSKGSRRSGPELFWSSARARIAFTVCLALSVIAHGLAMPFDFPRGVEVRDVEGQAAIAVDLLAENTPAEEVSAPAPAAPESEPPHEKALPATPRTLERDADAGSNLGADAASDAESDADAGSNRRADAASDAESDARAADSGLLAAEGGADAGSRDPEAIAKALQTDVVLVSMMINTEVIRKNPVGASLGALLRGVPQWNEFMEGTDIDPIRDADWVMISGPSLVNTGRDVVLIRYGAPDAVVDRAIATVSHRYGRRGRLDLGVPGVRATLAHADRAERALLRPAPHVLAVVAPDAAARVARQLAASRIPAHVLPGQAFFMRFVSPHRAVPEIPESINELRVRVVTRADDGADVHAEGDASDSRAASQAALEITHAIRRRNSGLVSLLTRGLFDNVEVTSAGSQVLVELAVSRDQLETLASLAAAFLGIDAPSAVQAGARPSAGASAASAASAARGGPRVVPTPSAAQKAR